MNVKGYIAYLNKIGNQQHYIGRINDLLELEKELNIDLDVLLSGNECEDFYSSIMNKLPYEKRYNEPLWFSLNSYLRYLLSQNRDDEPNQTKLSEECSDYFTFSGTETQLREKLLTFLTDSDCTKLIETIHEYHVCLGNGEYIEKVTTFPSRESEDESKMLNLLVGSSQYNINISALTLTAIALLLDIHVTLGFAATTLSILGFNSQAIARVNISEGEACMIMEAQQKNNRVIGVHVLDECRGYCVHYDLACKYKDGDRCTIAKENIRAILDGLCEKNIFTKIHGFYKYNF